MSQSDQNEKVEKWLKGILNNENFKEMTFQFPDSYDKTGGYSSNMTYVEVKGIKKSDNEEKILQILIKESKNDFVGPEAKGNFNFEQAYSNEVKFYTKIIPFFNKFAERKEITTGQFKNIPKCYAAFQDEDYKSFILVLENLKHKGFKINEIKSAMDLKQAKLVLEAYAKFHAFSFAIKDQEPEIFEKLIPANDSRSFTKNPIFDLCISTSKKELEKVKKIYNEKNRQIIVDKLDNLQKVYEQLFRESLNVGDNDKYLVLRHGDNWNNNFLFHYDQNKNIPDDVVILDWQLSILGSPLMDIIMFLFFCCSINQLEHIYELLDFYYDILKEKIGKLGSNPEKCFPKEYFLKEFHKYIALGVAAMPGAVKMRHQVKMKETIDFSEGSTDFSDIFDGPLRDGDEYLEEIEGILGVCIKNGFI